MVFVALSTIVPSDPAQKHLGGGKNHFLSLFLDASKARAEILEKHYSGRANLDKVIKVERSLPSLISQGALGKYGYLPITLWQCTWVKSTFIGPSLFCATVMDLSYVIEFY